MKILKQNVPLKNYSNYKIGGPAEYFLDVSSKRELIDGLEEWREISKDSSDKKRKITILSAGSNVLIDDNGIDGLVIHNGIKDINVKDNLITVGSGVLIKDFLRACVKYSLSGFEWAGGLPGAIGGAVRGNAGAFGGEMKDSLVSVKSIDLNTLEEINRQNSECEFSYRSSIFKKEKKDELILYATFSLSHGEREEIEKKILEKIEYRNLKHPMDMPSLGSTFKNIPFDSLSAEKKEEFKNFVKNDPVPILPVAKLLHLANLKGKRIGDAQVSEKHPNFIVNLGNAKSEDVKSLINFIKNAIKEKFEINLEEEIAYLPN